MKFCGIVANRAEKHVLASTFSIFAQLNIIFQLMVQRDYWHECKTHRLNRLKYSASYLNRIAKCGSSPTSICIMINTPDIAVGLVLKLENNAITLALPRCSQ